MSLAGKARAQATPQDLALADERLVLDWAHLDAMLNRATNQLLAAPAGRAAVFAGNSVETALAYLACLHAGVSSVPVNFHLKAAEVAYILREGGATTLFVGPETVEVGLEAARTTGIATVIGWRCAPQEGLIDWDDWLRAGSDAEPPTDMPPQPHLHFTSGTTGRPKGAETPPTMLPRTKTVADLFAKLRETFEAHGALSPSLIVSPIYHTGPLDSLRAVGGGAATVILSRFDAEAVLKAIDTYRIQLVLMVPTHFQRLLKLAPETRARYDISSLKVVGHTGAACPRDVKQQMIEWFGPVIAEAYGATESGTTNMITSEEWLRKPGSVGRTLPPFELIVVSEEGARLGPNQPGQLYFRDTTGRGIVYHNDAAKTKAAHLEPAVFTLGEVGYFDEDGYLFITDRVSDMIVSGGVNIYPAETEQVLIEHPQVADVAVIGAPNADMGEEVLALIIPVDPASLPAEAELDAFCRCRLAGFKCPRAYVFTDDIGRNAMGKINKRELRSRFWPGERTIGG